MMLYRHEYLLIGSGVDRFKTALGLHKPDRARLKSETYWNNRVTPLPPGVHCWLREEPELAAQLCIQQPEQPTICLAYTGEDVGSIVLGHRERLGLPPCQPANSSGLFADTKIQAYEECYQQDQMTLILQQGIVYFALNQAGYLRLPQLEDWVFIGAEPQATHLTLTTTTPKLSGKLARALVESAALPTIAPADHAQQLMRMQAWWWGGKRPINQPVADQIPQIAELEIESKLAVTNDFSLASWCLSQAIQAQSLPGFVPYQERLWVRHSHDVVRYLKGKHKLLLQGAAYRFGEKSLGSPPDSDHPLVSSPIMIRQESKPAYSPIASFVTAQAILAQAQARKPLGDLACHKRKFLLQSATTGGGYHVLIDCSIALAQPAKRLVQIEVECQWKKLPPSQPIADPIGTAMGEIEQLTQALCAVLAGTQPTQLTKRSWLKQLLA